MDGYSSAANASHFSHLLAMEEPNHFGTPDKLWISLLNLPYPAKKCAMMQMKISAQIAYSLLSDEAFTQMGRFIGKVEKLTMFFERRRLGICILDNDSFPSIYIQFVDNEMEFPHQYNWRRRRVVDARPHTTFDYENLIEVSIPLSVTVDGKELQQARPEHTVNDWISYICQLFKCDCLTLKMSMECSHYSIQSIVSMFKGLPIDTIDTFDVREYGRALLNELLPIRKTILWITPFPTKEVEWEELLSRELRHLEFRCFRYPLKVEDVLRIENITVLGLENSNFSAPDANLILKKWLNGWKLEAIVFKMETHHGLFDGIVHTTAQTDVFGPLDHLIMNEDCTTEYYEIERNDGLSARVTIKVGHWFKLIVI